MSRLPLSAPLLGLSWLVLSGCTVLSPLSDRDYLANMTVREPRITAAADGAYEGTATVVVPPGTWVVNRTVRVQVEVAGGAYQDIRILSPPDINQEDRYRALVRRIVDRQSLQVDGVTGTTYTGKAVLLAAAEALP